MIAFISIDIVIQYSHSKLLQIERHQNSHLEFFKQMRKMSQKAENKYNRREGCALLPFSYHLTLCPFSEGKFAVFKPAKSQLKLQDTVKFTTNSNIKHAQKNIEDFHVHLSWQEITEKPAWEFKISFDNEIVRCTPNLIIK